MTTSAPLDFGALAQSYLAANPGPSSAPSAGDSTINTIVGAVEIGGAGVLMAYLNGRSPAEDKTHHEIFGYPTDAVLGFGGVALGAILALFGSKAYGHVLRIGLGCLIEAGIRMGLEKGVVDRETDKAQAALNGKKAALRLVETKQPRDQSVRAEIPRTATTPATAPAQQGDVFQGVGR
jgi:hypothetical protein